MFSIPSPLHPALVHFPIVLILLGTLVAVVAVFLRRWHLPWPAAGLLLAGAVRSGIQAQARRLIRMQMDARLAMFHV